MKALVVIISFLFFLSIGGTYATWRFADNTPHSASEEANINLMEFEFKPEEILPGGDAEEAPMGESHFKLLDLILNEESKGYGLNINNNVLLHRYLRSEGVVYSNQKVSGGNLKFILDAKQNTHGLYYCLEKITDTEYYCYTFSTSDLETYAGTNTEIQVYRTILLKTDIWRGTTSAYGYAQIKSLSYLGVSADPNSIAYSIDVRTWHSKYAVTG